MSRTTKWRLLSILPAFITALGLWQWSQWQNPIALVAAFIGIIAFILYWRVGFLPENKQKNEQKSE
jgi:hypothetical protein